MQNSILIGVYFLQKIEKISFSPTFYEFKNKFFGRRYCDINLNLEFICLQMPDYINCNLLSLQSLRFYLVALVPSLNLLIQNKIFINFTC